MRSDKILSKYDCERIKNTFARYNATSETEKAIIEFLKKEIKQFKQVEPQKMKSNVVTMNSKFILTNLGNGKKEEYHLVFPDDTNLNKGKISVLSPLGAQILGSPVGTVIKENSKAESYYIIESITYQPESNGHYHLWGYFVTKIITLIKFFLLTQ